MLRVNSVSFHQVPPPFSTNAFSNRWKNKNPPIGMIPDSECNLRSSQCRSSAVIPAATAGAATASASAISLPVSRAPLAGRDYFVHRLDQFADVAHRTVESDLFGSGELDFHDALDAARADHDRHSRKQPLHAVFAVKVRGAWQHLLAIEHERLDHFVNRSARRVVRRSLHQLDDFAATSARALLDFLEPLRGDQP